MNEKITLWIIRRGLKIWQGGGLSFGKYCPCNAEQYVA